MKKKWCMVLLVLMMVFLTACTGKSREVPDSEVEYIVERYLNENTMEGCIGSSFEVTHDWNADSNTDSIHLKVITEYKYGSLIAERQCDFQYDKSSDLWMAKSMSQWSETIEYGNCFDGAVFEGMDDFENIRYQIKVNHVDFEKEEIDWEWQLNGTPSGYYPNVEIGKAEVAVIGVHPADEYFAYTSSGTEKYIPYFTAAVAIGSMRFTINFTLLGVARAYFWV